MTPDIQKMVDEPAAHPCPICFGKGRWPAISDAEWKAHGGRRGSDYIQSCAYCRGSGDDPRARQALTGRAGG